MMYLKPLDRVGRHVNDIAYEVPFAHIDYYKFSYFPRTIREWNFLSNEGVNAPLNLCLVIHLTIIYLFICFYFFILPLNDLQE